MFFQKKATTSLFILCLNLLTEKTNCVTNNEYPDELTAFVACESSEEFYAFLIDQKPPKETFNDKNIKSFEYGLSTILTDRENQKYTNTICDEINFEFLEVLYENEVLVFKSGQKLVNEYTEESLGKHFEILHQFIQKLNALSAKYSEKIGDEDKEFVEECIALLKKQSNQQISLLL